MVLTSQAGFSPETVALIEVVRIAAEPLNPATVAESASLKRMTVQNYFSRWFTKGWLERVGRGEYKRTEFFPAKAEPAAA